MAGMIGEVIDESPAQTNVLAAPRGIGEVIDETPTSVQAAVAEKPTYAQSLGRTFGQPIQQLNEGPADVTDLRATMSGAPSKRPDGTYKGTGYLGVLKLPGTDNVATEYSIGVQINGKQMDIPSLVPTLTRQEIEQTLDAAAKGKFPPKSVIVKATSFAEQRLKAGKPLFATADDTKGDDYLPVWQPSSGPQSSTKGNPITSTPGGAAVGSTRVPGARRELPGTGTALGIAGQVMDLGISAVGQFASIPLYWGPRIALEFSGENAKNAQTAAQLVVDSFIKPEFVTPFAKVAEALGPKAQKYYNENPVAFAMGEFGKMLEHGGKKLADFSGAQPEDVMAFVNQMMGAGGTAWAKAKVKPSLEARLEQYKNAVGRRREAAKPPAAPDGSSAYEVNEQPPALRRMDEEAAAKVAAATELETRIGGTAYEIGSFDHTGKAVDPILQIATEKMTRGELLSSAEAKALRDAAQTTERLPGMPAGKQGGKADWRALTGAFLATGVGVALGPAIYDAYKNWETSQPTGIPELVGMAAAGIIAKPKRLVRIGVGKGYEHQVAWIDRALERHSLPRDLPVEDFDMTSFPDKGDAIDAIRRGDLVVGQHLSFKAKGDAPDYFYNKNNDNLVKAAHAKGADVLLLGEQPDGTQNPNGVLYKAPAIVGKQDFAKLPETSLIEALRAPKDSPAATQNYNAAVTHLVQKEMPRAQRVIRGIVKDDARAEDLAQETLMAVLRRVEDGTFQGDAQLGTYIHRAATNRALNELTARKRRVTEEELTQENSAAAISGEATPEQAMMEKQLGEHITAGMEKLPKEMKEALELREQDGMSYEDIAARQGVPVGTIRSRLSRGKEMLSEYLKKKGVDVKTGMAAAALGTAGLWDEDHPEYGLLGGAILAVKAKGGMWHPEAVTRLVEPIASRLETPRGWDQADGPVRVTTDAMKGVRPQITKMMQGYLNKHAGTATDPLAKVEIPYGEGTMSWEKLMDATIESQKAKNYLQPPDGNYRSKIAREQRDLVKDIPPEEDIYNLSVLGIPEGGYLGNGLGEGRAYNAITSYLSHVGDFLRQNVPADKLPQYDLVRAVKETAANDERVAALAMKEALKGNEWKAEQQQHLPVYKEYPAQRLPARTFRIGKENGQIGLKNMNELKLPEETLTLSWRELALPEKLMEEQARFVRQITPEETKSLSYQGRYGVDRIALRKDMYVALDAKGKVIKDNYTGDHVLGNTPEEAWLAGQTVMEGNSLAHCVGGYCGAVVSGESKLYSLRDEKGRSFATVEVGKGEITKAQVQQALKAAGKTMEDWVAATEEKLQGGLLTDARYKKAHAYAIEKLGLKLDSSANILQIKGPGNHALSPEYQKYAQDFVRNPPNGKPWGEVADLENVRLRDIREAKGQGGTDLGGEAFFGQPYVTAEQFKRFQAGSRDPDLKAGNTNIPRGQEGKADPRLLAGIAAGGAALASYLSDNMPEWDETGAMIGIGAIGLKGMKRGAADLVNSVDIGLGRSSTRLANIAPQLRRATRDMELASNVAKTLASTRIETLKGAVEDLPPDTQAAFTRAALDNDPHEMSRALRGNPAAVAAYREVRTWLDATGDKLISFGRFAKGIQEYMPRVMKDVEGFLAAQGKELALPLERLLAEAEKKSFKTRDRGLSNVEKSILINNWLARDTEVVSSSLPGFAKSRTVKMTDEVAKYYHNLWDSLSMYAHAAHEDIATTEFFGRDAVTSMQAGKKFTNVGKSVGALVNRLRDSGEVDAKGAVELSGILQARFGKGEESPHWFLQDVRNVTGALTLGQIGSGLLQMTESLLGAYHHGAVPVVKAVGIMLTGKGIKPREFGLADHIIEETVGKRFTGKLLGTVLHANLLRTFDQLGIQTNLTASFVKNKALVQSLKGIAKLQEKWGADYGTDFSQLVEELQQSKINERSPLVESLLWQEISDVRPTSRIENSQAFNANPNLRLAWQYKQFMSTQLDIVRRDSYNKIKTGNPKQVAIGVKNLLLYATAMSASLVPINMVKDWIAGRDFDPDIEWVTNFTQNFGLNRYVMDKMDVSKTPVKAGMQAVTGAVVPPALGTLYQLGAAVSDPKKLVPMIPVGGRAAYDRWLGGNEQKEITKVEAENRATRKRLGLEKGEKLPEFERKVLSDAAKAYRKQQREAQ